MRNWRLALFWCAWPLPIISTAPPRWARAETLLRPTSRAVDDTFGLKPLEAAKLRATCEALERHAPGTPEFARILRDEVAYEDRKALADAMWAVALADGQRDDDEEAMLTSIENALGLSDGDIEEARQTALRRD